MSISNPEYSQSNILRPIEIKGGHHSKGSVPALTLAAIGVVFGDIGTSPLYALKECFSPEHGIPFSADAVFGVISMVFWAFLIVVSLKYVLFVMRANNHGEGDTGLDGFSSQNCASKFQEGVNDHDARRIWCLHVLWGCRNYPRNFSAVGG